MIGAILAKRGLADAMGALNNHDLAKFMSSWHDDGVFVYPGEIHASGTFKGKDAVEGWFRNFLEQFPGIKFKIRHICVENIFAVTGTNVVAITWDLDLKNCEGRAGVNSGVTVATLKGGKVILLEDFLYDVGKEFKLNWSAL